MARLLPTSGGGFPAPAARCGNVFFLLFLFCGCVALAHGVFADSPAAEAKGNTNTAPDGSRVVLVTGATGRTGTALYHQLRDGSTRRRSSNWTVRALVRNLTKARVRLGCDRCDPSEGIYQADVTDQASLPPAFAGVDTVVVLTGSYPTRLPNGTFVYAKGATPRDVDYLGTNKQVRAAVAAGTVRHFVFVSSMGTTTPGNFLDSLADGHGMAYKLNAESYLMQQPTLDWTIVKPSGLLPATGAGPTNASYVLGHSDCLAPCPSGSASCYNITRDDLAAVLAEAVTHYAADSNGVPLLFRNARFDLSSDPALLVDGSNRNWNLLSSRASDLEYPTAMGCALQ